MRYEDKLIALQLTPGTCIAIAQLDEIDETLEFGAPLK